MIIGISGKAGAGKDTMADMLVNKHMFIKVSLADVMKRICKEIFDFSDEQLWGPSKYRNEPDIRYRRKPYRYDTVRGNSPNGKAYEDITDLEDQRVFNALDVDPDSSPIFLTPRYALQTFGTDWARDCYEDIWVSYAFRVADKILNEGYHYSQKSGLWRGIATSMPGRYEGVIIPDCRFPNEITQIKAKGGRVIRIKRNTSIQGKEAQHASETAQDSMPDSFFDAVVQNYGTLKELAETVEQVYNKVLV